MDISNVIDEVKLNTEIEIGVLKDLQYKVKHYMYASKKFKIFYWPVGKYCGKTLKNRNRKDLKTFTVPADTKNDALNIFNLVVPHDQIHNIIEMNQSVTKSQSFRYNSYVTSKQEMLI